MISPGAMLGRYRLDAQVGQGGMAVVWRGFDTQLRRVVAVKVLHPHLHAREEIRRRFDREAHAVARLHHPHILDVYDFSGPDAAPSYLVTEFIPGQSLRQFAEAHPFDPPELAACCALPLAAALGHAHQGGVVHRDVKPENVMVREDGQIKLTDFGIAALLDPDEKFTVTGSILGSPAHLAPETIDGRPADTRSDLFSLGTLLYWLACGKLPFHAPTPAALLRQILEGTPQDPRMVRRSVSDGLAKIIARLLERDPEKRYQTAAEVQKDLEALLAQAGLDDPLATLRDFVQGKPPESVGAALRTRLVARALQDGEAALKEKRTSAALALFGRVLALEPGHQAAKARVDRLRSRARRLRRLKQVTGAYLTLSALVGAGWFYFQHPRTAAPVSPAVATGSTPATTLSPQPDAGVAPGDPVAALTSPGATSTAAGLPSDGPPRSLLASLAPAGEQRRIPGQVRAPPEAQPLDKDKGRHAKPEGDPPRSPRVAGVAKVAVTLLLRKIAARVILDGEDLGQNLTFNRELTVGTHKANVIHDCCTDRPQNVEVTADNHRYPLEFGQPKPARLVLKGAPPDAPVQVDGIPYGLASSISDKQLSTGQSPDKRVPLIVGDRSGMVTLKAGAPTTVDYLMQLKPGQVAEP